MGKRKQKVAGLLQRFEFTDFSGFIARPHSQRYSALKAYIDRASGNWGSYGPFRASIADIAGVERPLDPGEKLTLSEILRSIKVRSQRGNRDDYAMNKEAASAYFEYIRRVGVTAYDDHPRAPLYIAADRRISMRIEHYIVEGGCGSFQFVNPRRTSLEPDEAAIAMSLVHQAYAVGDYADFDVEIVELGPVETVGPRGGRVYGDERCPRSIKLSQLEIRDKAWLDEQANHIYSLLLRIAEDPD